MPTHAAVCAQLHSLCFDRPWSEQSFLNTLSDLNVFGFYVEEEGFILCRSVHDEAEILTLCTVPQKRRSGLGSYLVGVAIEAFRERGVLNIHLEVAEMNLAARALYIKLGFRETGCRPNYYGTETAILMQFDCSD